MIFRTTCLGYTSFVFHCFYDYFLEIKSNKEFRDDTKTHNAAMKTVTVQLLIILAINRLTHFLSNMEEKLVHILIWFDILKLINSYLIYLLSKLTATKIWLFLKQSFEHYIIDCNSYFPQFVYCLMKL